MLIHTRAKTRIFQVSFHGLCLCMHSGKFNTAHVLHAAPRGRLAVSRMPRASDLILHHRNSANGHQLDLQFPCMASIRRRTLQATIRCPFLFLNEPCVTRHAAARKLLRFHLVSEFDRTRRCFDVATLSGCHRPGLVAEVAGPCSRRAPVTLRDTGARGDRLTARSTNGTHARH